VTEASQDKKEMLCILPPPLSRVDISMSETTSANTENKLSLARPRVLRG